MIAEKTTMLEDEIKNLKVVINDAVKKLGQKIENSVIKVMKDNKKKCKNLEKSVVKICDIAEEEIAVIEDIERDVSKINKIVKKQTYEARKSQQKQKKTEDLKHRKSITNRASDGSNVKIVNDLESKKVHEKSQKKSHEADANIEIKKRAKKRPEKPHEKTSNILYVTDSVGRNIDISEVERKHDCKIRTAIIDKSDCAISDFERITFANLRNPGKEPYKFLMLSALSDIITNNATENEVTEACHKLVKIAEKALKNHKYLEKVILIGHPPRYDHKKRVDLAMLANTILQHLCSLSPLKGKVCVGLHDLFSYGIGHTHMKRFRDIVTGDYDGIYMWGPTGR